MSAVSMMSLFLSAPWTLVTCAAASRVFADSCFFTYALKASTVDCSGAAVLEEPVALEDPRLLEELVPLEDPVDAAEDAAPAEESSEPDPTADAIPPITITARTPRQPSLALDRFFGGTGGCGYPGCCGNPGCCGSPGWCGY